MYVLLLVCSLTYRYMFWVAGIRGGGARIRGGGTGIRGGGIRGGRAGIRGGEWVYREGNGYKGRMNGYTRRGVGIRGRGVGVKGGGADIRRRGGCKGRGIQHQEYIMTFNEVLNTIAHNWYTYSFVMLYKFPSKN